MKRITAAIQASTPFEAIEQFKFKIGDKHPIEDLTCTKIEVDGSILSTVYGATHLIVATFGEESDEAEQEST